MQRRSLEILRTEAAWAVVTTLWLSSWSQGTWAWQRILNFRRGCSGCSRNCWTGSPGNKSLDTKEWNKAGYSLRMRDLSIPQNKKAGGETGNQHSLARTCWQNCGRRRTSTVSGSKDVSPGKDIRMLYASIEIELIETGLAVGIIILV